MNATLTDIREAIETLILANITVANGYSTGIVSSHIYTATSKAMTRKLDTDYPKFIVVAGEGKHVQLPSRQKAKLVSFDVLAVFKATTAVPATPVEQAENFVEDLEGAVNTNITLGGLVENVLMTDFVTDSGFADPEGLVHAKILVAYKTVG